MEMPINASRATFMHVDLNSCFAIVEQQANPLIRNKPVAIAAYDTPHGMIIASSYEAKALGIKLGLNVSQARQIFPGLIVLTPDPDKYFDVHRRFRQLLLSYTDKIEARSVDEFLIDFRGSALLRKGFSLEQIGQAIKEDVKFKIGQYITINVGIGNNPFQAKLAASLHKPDGLDRIDGTNLESVFDKLSLLDLPGINYRYQARLNLAGIYSGRDFLNASLDKLQKEVFRGINGYYWYLRLRGYEIDTINFNRKSFGAQYTLAQKTTDLDQLARILMKLSEKVGRRMRAKGYSGQGIKLFLKLIDGTVVVKHSHPGYQLYATPDIYQVVFSLLNLILLGQPVRELGVSVYGLNSIQLAQQSLFGNTYNSIKIAQAMDAINDKYGEYKITMALMANMKDVIIKRVAFGKNDQ